MDDREFMAWLHGYCYVVQRAGYGDGPVPDSFVPIVPFFKNLDGSIDRSKTLGAGSPFESVAGVQRQKLLAYPVHGPGSIGA